LLNKKNVRGRIAEILFHLSQNIYQSLDFELGFTRHELGNLANTSTETVIRIFSELKKEGIINIVNKGIKINDLNRLKKIIEISS
jgi:CRP-like cAMP-binding protein